MAQGKRPIPLNFRSAQGRALTLLVLAAGGVIFFFHLRNNFLGGLFLAACEAGLIGGVADWFAVVALFRHPLNISWLPHTAIIPSNRDKIINVIVDIVENEWLKASIIKEKIQSTSLAGKVTDLIAGGRGEQSLRLVAGSVMDDVLQSLDPEKLAAQLEKSIRESALQLDAVPVLKDILRVVESNSYGDKVLDLFIDEIILFIKRADSREMIVKYLKKAVNDYKKSGILKRLSADAGELLRIIDYDEAANVALTRMLELIEEMKYPENEFRIRLKSTFGEFVCGLDQDREFTRAINEWKNEALQRVDLLHPLVELLSSFKQYSSSGDNGPRKKMLNYVMEFIFGQLDQIKNDPEKNLKVDRWLKSQLIRVVDENHSLIGSLVRDNLERLNVKSFVSSIEERVSDDLQWIRINGTVVGALVGIVQYLALHLFSSPGILTWGARHFIP